MRPSSAALLATLVASLLPLTIRAVDYQSFNAPDAGETIITGIRGSSDVNGAVVITGSLTTSGGNTQPVIFEGNIFAPNAGTWTPLTPVIGTQDITTSTLYGPNTGYYDSGLGPNGIRAVGSYKYSNDGNDGLYDHGLMYTRVNDVETWTQFDMPNGVAGGTVLYTIAHSTMGNYVVGNYDTQLDEGRAFIYDIGDGSFAKFTPTPVGMNVTSLTAYGIWDNGNGSYTIAGGYSDLSSNILDAGYLVDFHPGSAEGEIFRNFTTFQYENQPLASLVSHFDGIVATEDGYYLTGDHITLDVNGIPDPSTELGFFAFVERLEDGSFKPLADWTNINFPDAAITSGNTVYGANVLGVATGGDVESTSYIATVPEPSTLGLAALATSGLILLARRRRSAQA